MNLNLFEFIEVLRAKHGACGISVSEDDTVTVTSPGRSFHLGNIEDAIAGAEATYNELTRNRNHDQLVHCTED